MVAFLLLRWNILMLFGCYNKTFIGILTKLSRERKPDPLQLYGFRIRGTNCCLVFVMMNTSIMVRGAMHPLYLNSHKIKQTKKLVNSFLYIISIY